MGTMVVPTGTTVLQGTTGYYGYYGTTNGYYGSTHGYYSTQNRVLQGTTGIRSRRNEQVKAYILYIYIMVLQDTDLKNPEKTRQGKASKRREDQREDKENKKWQGLRGFFCCRAGR